jgi:hypothetical protein
MLEGDARHGSLGSGLGPEDGRRLLRAWLSEMELGVDTAGLLATMQAEDFSHSDLERRARRVDERKLTGAIDELLATGGSDGIAPVLSSLFAACLPAVPYVPAAAFLAREQAKLVGRDGDPIRVAVVADGPGAVHGVTHTLQQLRERGIRGHEIEVIGTDASVDRRLTAVSEIELPFFAGLKLGVPSVFAVAEALTERRYDLFNVLYVGRLSQEKGIDLLAESFLIARDHDPRLHLVLAGRGPEEESLRRRLGSAATFLGWVGGDRLAQVYASADLFMFASTTDTFGQVILEAQASGLPVLATNAAVRPSSWRMAAAAASSPPTPSRSRVPCAVWRGARRSASASPPGGCSRSASARASVRWTSSRTATDARSTPGRSPRPRTSPKAASSRVPPEPAVAATPALEHHLVVPGREGSGDPSSARRRPSRPLHRR